MSEPLKIGDKINDLVVVGKAKPYIHISPSRTRSYRRFKFRCEVETNGIICGKIFTSLEGKVRYGRTKSCGKCAKTIHNMSFHPLYVICYGAIRRCHNENSHDYNNYGARGIKVYKPWRDDIAKFIRWIEENLGPRPSKNHSLDRINTNKGYVPGNLKWSTTIQQNRNQRSNRLFTFKDKKTGKMKTQCLAAWCEEYGINYYVVSTRISQLEWNFRKAILTPINIEYFVINGISNTIPKWCDIYNIDYKTVKARINRGWKILRALTTPIDKRFSINS